MATGTVMPSPKFTGWDSNGDPLNAGKLYSYIAGTSTLLSTYNDVDLAPGHSNTNPVILDSAGRATIFLAPGLSYKFILQDSAGGAVWTQDNVSAMPASAGNLDITGTAGEALTAGQAVYLSDGSGSKTTGLWYKADSANLYSSTNAVMVGIVPSSIVISAAGTIRVAGQATGLTSLTVGSTYYIGTAGALTTTAPTNARVLGIADTTSTLLLAANPGTPVADNGVFDFRLSLTTGVPVTTADVTAATSLLCVPFRGNRLTLYNSVGYPTTFQSPQMSIAIPATASTNYDVFAFDSSGTPTLELLAWRNSGQAVTGATNATPIVITAVAHGLSNGDEVYISGVVGNTAANGTWTVANKAADTFELSTSVGNGAYTAATGYLNARASTGKLVLTTTGTYTKTADLTRRYVGMVRTTTVSGQTEDSLLKRYVWNHYNRVTKPIRVIEASATWTYGTATTRQANGNTANQADAIVGIGDAVATMTLLVFGNNSAANIFEYGIGEDSTTTIAAESLGNQATSPAAVNTIGISQFSKRPVPGRHTYVWLEKGAGAGTMTWVGTSGNIKTGIIGTIEG